MIRTPSESLACLEGRWQIERLDVPADTASEILLDLGLLEERLRSRGTQAPAMNLHVVALEHIEPGKRTSLPDHRLPERPDDPADAHGYCDLAGWRQTFQCITLQSSGKGRPDVWVIAGGVAGALYGAGEVMSRTTGVIFHEVDPARAVFGPMRPLPMGPVSPSFPLRFRDGGGGPEKAVNPDALRWLARNRFNGRVYASGVWEQMDPGQRDAITRTLRARGMHLVVGYHAMDFFLPEDLFERHPEWFGWRDGQRQLKVNVDIPDAPHLKGLLPTQPCFSNDELVDVLSDRMADHIARFPEIDVFSLWPHDGINNWCQCPSCLELTPYEQVYRLADQLAGKTDRSLPIEVIAYTNMLTPPRHELPPNRRVISMLCPYLRPQRLRVFDPGGPELTLGTRYPEPDCVYPRDEREYGELFDLWTKAWNQSGNVPAIFEYGENLWFDESMRCERQRYLYRPDLDLRYDEARWYRDRGVRCMYLCSVHTNWPDAMHQLGFVESLWDCDGDPDAFTQRFYRAVAGDQAHELSERMASISSTLDEGGLPQEEVEALDAWLAERNDSPWARRYRLWCAYVLLALTSRRLEHQGLLDAVVEQEHRIDRFFEEHGPELDPVLNVAHAARYSGIRADRIRARQTNEIRTDYHL